MNSPSVAEPLPIHLTLRSRIYSTTEAGGVAVIRQKLKRIVVNASTLRGLRHGNSQQAKNSGFSGRCPELFLKTLGILNTLFVSSTA